MGLFLVFQPIYRGDLGMFPSPTTYNMRKNVNLLRGGSGGSDIMTAIIGPLWQLEVIEELKILSNFTAYILGASSELFQVPQSYSLELRIFLSHSLPYVDERDQTHQSVQN